MSSFQVVLLVPQNLFLEISESSLNVFCESSLNVFFDSSLNVFSECSVSVL